MTARLRDWNRAGHWYVTVERDGDRCEFAFPAIVTNAREMVERMMPGWRVVYETWRHSFDQRQLPCDSQPTYGRTFPGPETLRWQPRGLCSCSMRTDQGWLETRDGYWWCKDCDLPASNTPALT